MADQATTEKVVSALARVCHVLTLGGGAVIAHGLSRNTLDADIWLEPQEDAAKWSALLREVLKSFPSVTIQRIATWEVVPFENLAQMIEEDGVVRLVGMERPLDIFRRPNELETALFGEVWLRATPMIDGTRLPDTIDLLVTKQLTGRQKDRTDIIFLEQKAEAEGMILLSTDRVEEIRTLLERFLTPNLAAAAARHTDAGIRELALRYLRELAEEGDPFAVDLLREF